MHNPQDQYDTEALSLAAPAPGSDDQEPAATVEDGDLDDLCERWLGRDWPDTTSPAEAMRLATACQAKRDAGDTRDYTAILAEVIG
jgi:hypothetical protein